MVIGSLLSIFAYFAGIACSVAALRLRFHVETHRLLYVYAGKILGLKNFIETAEKEKLELLVHDDPLISIK
jgi:hypothetical protein